MGEIRYEHLFVDGTKIETNANKYSFVWQKSTSKYESRLLSKLEEIVACLCEQYGVCPQNEQTLLTQLRAQCGEKVHGRGRRKSQIQRDLEYLEGLLSRKAKYASYQETFQYDVVLDEYTCQNGKKLTAVYDGTRKSKSGFESTVTYYECEDCSLCPYKKSRTRAKGNRKFQVSKNFIRQRKESLKQITSPQGILLRMNRSIQSEGAFGVLKWDYGFQRFLHRGNKMVFTEILLLAMAQNIQKYHNKIQQNRTGIQLHTKLSA